MGCDPADVLDATKEAEFQSTHPVWDATFMPVFAASEL